MEEALHHDRAWFEMPDHRRRVLDSAAWIPLRAAQTLHSEGRYGYWGHSEEFFGAGSIAVPLEHRDAAETLGWMDVGIRFSQRPYVEDGQFVSADQYLDRNGGFVGIHLVLEQEISGPHPREWIVHPDLVLGFRLLREDDMWLAPDEGYEKVIELLRSPEGRPLRLSIRTEYLKDYLAARQMALYVTSYRNRREIGTETGYVWSEGEVQANAKGLRWEGHIAEIHEGGMPFGGKTAIVHVAHADFDAEQDVPVLPHPTEGKFDSESHVLSDQGKKLIVVTGELWREEWVEPGETSPRIRQDPVPSTATFIIDGAGTRRSGDDLQDVGRWLWFRPDVVPAIAHRRGGTLKWYTRDTGGVGCIPSSPVHFGVNRLGLVNIYAKVIAILPDWQQRIWAAFNVAPDGGIAEELQAAQIRGRPAETQAPEAYLRPGLELVAESSTQTYGVSFVRSHSDVLQIASRCHRFRAVDRPGLFALAKDLARLTADLFDAEALKAQLGLPSTEKLGSIKAMERVVALSVGVKDARDIMGPVVGIYEMRLGDAHLPKKEQGEALQLAGVDENQPLVNQGYQLVHACVRALYRISEAIQRGAQGTQS